MRAPYGEQLAALHQVVLERERVDSLFYRDGSTLNDRLFDGAKRYGVLEGSLNTDWRALAFGGFGRPLEEVWTVQDVIARYGDSADPEMYCGACRASGCHNAFRSRNVEAAIRWFRANHDGGCDSGDSGRLPAVEWFTRDAMIDNPHLRQRAWAHERKEAA